MTTEPERIFARRVVHGMFRASCDQLEPAWRTDPVWGTWEPNEPTERATEEDRRIKGMSEGELLAALEGSNHGSS